MKKLFIIFLSLLTIYVLGKAAFANENFLQIRYDKKYGEYLLFENSGLNGWLLGFQLINDIEGYRITIPHLYYKVFKNVHCGIRYSVDSLDQESLGPTIRYMDMIKGWFTILDATKYFDTKDDFDIGEIFWGISTTSESGWFCGFETLYYKIQNSTKNFKLRPIKIGYRLNWISPFVMIQRHWNDYGMKTDAIMLGFELYL